MIKIGPSILSADFGRLREEIKALEQAKADFLHIDIMDGHFVPNITMGPKIISDIKNYTNLFLDVHLMINDPEKYLMDYINAGSSQIIIHVESTKHLNRAISFIKSQNVKAGVSLNPTTHEQSLTYIIDDLDVVLLMSVNPGFCSQVFIKNSIEKINNVSALIKKSRNKNCPIAVDGGINEKTVKPCIKAGATIFISGSYIFEHKSYEEAIMTLRNGS